MAVCFSWRDRLLARLRKRYGEKLTSLMPMETSSMSRMGQRSDPRRRDAWSADEYRLPQHGPMLTARRQSRRRYSRCSRFGFTPPPRSLVRVAEPRKRALDGGDAACGHARVARRRVQLGMSEQSLDQPDVGAVLEQMRGKAVAQRMQADALPDPGRARRLVEQPAELTRHQMQPRPASGEQPALSAAARLLHRTGSTVPSTIAAAGRAPQAAAWRDDPLLKLAVGYSEQADLGRGDRRAA